MATSSPHFVVMTHRLNEWTCKHVQDALIAMGNSAAFQQLQRNFGLCIIKTQQQKDIKLQMLYKLQPLHLREWYQATSRLQPALASDTNDTTTQIGSALRALVQHMASQHKYGVVHVLSDTYQPCQSLIHVLQAAGAANIHVVFNAITAPAPDTGPTANLAATADMVAFRNDMCILDNVHVHQINADALGMECMIATWWQQAIQCDMVTPPSNLASGRAIIKHLTLCMPGKPAASSDSSGLRKVAPTDGLAETIPRTPVDTPSHGCRELLEFKCTVGSQMLRWNTSIRLTTPGEAKMLDEHSPVKALPFGEQPLAVLGATQKLNLPSQSMSMVQKRFKEHSSSEVNMKLQIRGAAKAAELNHALVYGWPHILQPLPADDSTIATTLPDSTATPQGCNTTQSAAASTTMFAALCKVLSERQQVLIASSDWALQDAGHVELSAVPTLYCLTPCASPASFLMKRVACREQLIPLATWSSLATDLDQETTEVACDVVDNLTKAWVAEDTYGHADASWSDADSCTFANGWLGSGCHDVMSVLLTGTQEQCNGA